MYKYRGNCLDRQIIQSIENGLDAVKKLLVIMTQRNIKFNCFLARWLLWRRLSRVASSSKILSRKKDDRFKSCTMIATTNSTEGGTQTETYIKYRDAPPPCYLGYNNDRFISQQSTFSAPSQHFLGIF